MPAEFRGSALPGEFGVIGFEMIFGEFVLALQKTEGFRLYDDAPKARFGADRTISFPCALGEIDIRFEFYLPAMAAAGIRFLHGLDSSLERSLIPRALTA
jgi:hypothetical protein